MAKFRTYYLPLIPDIVSTFPGGVSALRAAIFDRIRKECLAERDIERGRKIILHPLLVASIDNNESFMPMTFTLASDKNAAIYTE